MDKKKPRRQIDGATTPGANAPILSDAANGAGVVSTSSGKRRSRLVDDRGWRQPSAENQFNPDGLSLAAIDMELSGAFGPPGHGARFAWRRRAQRIRNLRARQLRDGGSFVDPAYADSFDDPSSPTALVWSDADRKRILVDPKLGLPTSEYLIQETDSGTASRIRATPILLLHDVQAQDALARWTYAKRWAREASTRRKAKDLLDVCLPPKMGNPGKLNVDPIRLLAAYDDLCRYCRCIFTCAEAVRTVSEVLKSFPDAEDLAPHGLNLQDVVNPKYKRPAPSDIAVSYIAAISELSSSRIMDFISAARIAADRAPASSAGS